MRRAGTAVASVGAASDSGLPVAAGGSMTSILDLLKAEEGFRATVYADSLGKLTLGYGTLVEAPGGITEAEAEMLLRNRIQVADADLDRALPWWRNETPERQMVLEAMCFQLGITGLLGFRQMLEAWQAQDWDGVRREMLNSRWAQQTPERVGRLVGMV